MSRSALLLSLAFHAGVVAFVGWASVATADRTGLGRAEIGIGFTAENTGGLLADDDSTSAPPAAVISAPVEEPAIALPVPPVDLRLSSSVSPVEPIAPPILSVTGLPQELPRLSPP